MILLFYVFVWFICVSPLDKCLFKYSLKKLVVTLASSSVGYRVIHWLWFNPWSTTNECINKWNSKTNVSPHLLKKQIKTKLVVMLRFKSSLYILVSIPYEIYNLQRFSPSLWVVFSLHALKHKIIKFSPNQSGSVCWASPCNMKGGYFYSQSGHMPGMQVWSPYGNINQHRLSGEEFHTTLCMKTFYSFVQENNLKCNNTGNTISKISESSYVLQNIKRVRRRGMRGRKTQSNMI